MLSHSVQQLPTRPCVQCGRPVVLCLTVNNKTMLVDPEPTESGSAYVRFESGRLLVEIQSKENPTPDGVPYVVHWATCPAANQSRTRKDKPIS